MSKGMWTKHIDPEGRIFYFNAAQNRSVWNSAPSDAAVIHEAPFLVSLDSVSSISTQSAIVHSSSFDNISIPTNNPTNSNVQPPQPIVKLDTVAMDLQAKIDQLLQQQRDAALAKKHQQKAVFGATGDSAQESTNQSEESSYLKQKNELEQLAGSKNGDTAKWYVR